MTTVEQPQQPHRLAAARETARSLVEMLEREEAPIERSLMTGQRLARLLRETDAERWLEFEMCGYPPSSNGIDLGTCNRYPLRFHPNKTFYQTSLPALEARSIGAKALLDKLNAASISAPADNYIAAGATKAVIADMHAQLRTARDEYVSAKTIFAQMKSRIHRWAADTLISLELGTMAESAFEQIRGRVDTFVARHVPDAATQLVAANERIRDGDVEALSAALTAARRALVSTADHLFPPQDTPIKDGLGRERKVGPQEYKNRLIAYMESRIASQSGRTLVEAELGHLIARLEALNDMACKGVHTNVTTHEARLVFVQLYMYLGELARLAGDMNVDAPNDAQSSRGDVPGAT